jgi:hypothetical protein
MVTLFQGEAAGTLRIPSLQSALARIRALEERIAELEALVEGRP